MGLGLAPTAPIPAPDLFARRRRGVAMITVAIALLATMDLLVKIASAEFSTVQIVWSRYVGQSLGLLAYAGSAGVLACFRSPIRRVHLGRAALLLVANVSFMAALRYLPLTEANLVGFASPLLMTALTYPMLGERVAVGGWIAVGLGFLGVLFVVKPSGAVFQWAALLPLLMALCAAVYHVMTPIVARVDDPTISLYFVGWIGVVLLSLVLPQFWVQPRGIGWLVLGSIGLLGTAGQILIIRSFQLAPPSLLAPFFYFHLVWAVIYDFAIFASVPSLSTGVGAALILASGLYVYWAGNRPKNAALPSAPATRTT